ncbi:MAG: hypothetical protein KGL39_56020 [Patescibacteria group bacterium]|nr:hypothetical protein [Patescibacteria group bacterium]
MDESESFRAACEMRWCLAQSQTERTAYYQLVLKHRGKEAANRLIESVNLARRATPVTTPSAAGQTGLF